MVAKRHIIIGGGSAALSALEKIRSIRGEDEIKVITKEHFSLILLQLSLISYPEE